MKVRALQQQLATLQHLLPTQRDILSRLFFQMAFNDFTKFALIGPEGSGKTTLVLALAELFSACDEETVNVAMLQAPLSDASILSQLSQQWFAQSDLTKTELFERLAAGAADQEWVLIVDDLEQLTDSQVEWLLSLPGKQFMFGKHSAVAMQLNLALPVITLADAEHLLQVTALDPLTLAERFANSQGNLHKLLNNADPLSTSKTTGITGKNKRVLVTALGVSLCLMAVVVLFIQSKQTIPSRPTVDKVLLPAATEVVRLPALTEQPENTLDDQAESEIVAIEPLSSDVALVDIPPVTTEASAVAEITPTAESATPDEVTAQALPVSTALVATQSAKAQSAETESVKPQSVKPAEPGVYDHAALLQLSNKDWVVQLAALSDENAVSRVKLSHPQQQILVYRRRWQGKEQWILVSGPFANSAAAKRYIQQLPTSLSASGPFLKRVAAVQQEINAWQGVASANSNQDN